MNSLKSKNVLVIGGLGFLGSNLAIECVKGGANVVIYDSLDPFAGGSISNISSVESKCKVLFKDLLSFSDLSEAVANCNLIFNCAASTSHPYSMKAPFLNLDANGKGVLNLLEAIRRFNPGARMVHLGTTSQIGKLLYSPADENHPEFPLDIYSANKSASEKYVLIYANAYNLKVSVVRLPNTYGPRAFMDSPDFTFNNFFIGQALKGKEITVYGDGAQLRNSLYIKDAIDAILKVSACSDSVGLTLQAASSEHHTVSHIAHETIRHIGSGSLSYVPWPKARKAIEIGDVILSNDKIRAVTGWVPKFTLSDGLADCATYYHNLSL